VRENTCALNYTQDTHGYTKNGKVLERNNTEKIRLRERSAQSFFRRQHKPTRSEVNKKQKLRIVSYNCKNIKTSTQAINHLLRENNVILIQEHWLFQFQIHKLGEIAADICFEGKSVDIQNNINPSQQPRGYGDVAVIWKKEIHHLIKPCKDGNERIQCIEFKDNNQRPLLIVSVYLPTKGCHDLDEYIDSIDQLFEIYQKYNLTHDILIGGDINEDLTKKSNDYRANYINQFINECHLKKKLQAILS
jgi:ribosomal protein L44E